jgi:hypothetical protein
VLFPLPKISDPQVAPETVGRKTAVDTRPFTALHATFGQISDFSVPLLEYPATLVAGPRAVLQYASEGVGSLNPTVLQLAFHDPVYGDLWTTKPERAPQKAFYESCSDVNPSAHGAFEACLDLPDYTDNAFYFFRPDGTYLSYVYNPDFRPEDRGAVAWQDGPLPEGTSYQYRTVVGCEWAGANAASVVSPSSVSVGDLEPIARVRVTGDPLYGLKDKNHPLYKEFYADYVKSFPSWGSQTGDDQHLAQVSYDNFLKARPVFLWKDPFGRLIRFVNTQFLLPNACEPILYLYPEQKQDIEVKLGEDVAVVNSYPAYQNGWLVSAQPDGELTDFRSGRRFPYLFWEGHSYILPMETEGFVVKSSDVPAFLEATLPKLGLNPKEAGDFMTAWSSKLSGAPYYFITFLDKSVIDQFYPLRIDPPPDTTIRILMDFTALSRPILVQPPSLARPPQRQGFTVVEWGVLVR